MQNAAVITQVREVGDVLSGGKSDALFAGVLHGNCSWLRGGDMGMNTNNVSRGI